MATRWFQFRLRTLLIVVTLVAVPAAVFGPQIAQWWRRPAPIYTKTEMRQLLEEWEHIWAGEQPDDMSPKRVHGGVI